MSNLAGGSLYAGMGGFLKIFPNNQPQVVSNYDAIGFDPLTLFGNQAYILDIAEWQLTKVFNSKKCTHSGSFGAINRRRTGIDWMATIKVFWDARNPPENLIQTGYGFAVNLFIGDYRAWIANNETQRVWTAPSAYAKQLIATNNSEGDEIYTEEWLIEGNSHISLLPDEQAFYDQYIAFLQSRNEVG